MQLDPVPALKRQAAEAIKRELERHYDAGAALLLETDQPRVSNLRRGRLDRFSLETLLRFATRIGLDVELRFERRRFTIVQDGSAAGPGA